MDKPERGRPRACARCRRSLSRYNNGDYCGGCSTVPVPGCDAHFGGDTPAELGARLRQARLRRGMTLKVAAGRAGFSAAYLSMVENGKRELNRYSRIIALADVLGVQPGELVPDLSASAEPANRISSSVPAKRPSAVADLSAVLLDFGLASGRSDAVSLGEVPLVRDLERDVQVAFGQYQQGRFTSAARRASRLLADAQLAAAECAGPDRGRALRVLALAYQAAGTVLAKMGQADLALLAAERGLNAAEQAGIPVIRGSLLRCAAFTLHSAGRFEAAMRLVDSGAAYLEDQAGGRDATWLSVYGTLLLVGSMAAARSGDSVRTSAYLAEAGGAAQRLGGDANHLWTAFGPTNVAIHRVNTAVELGDISAALSAGLSLRTGAVPAERRARYLLDVARTYVLTGKRDSALHAMLMAERTAPEQIRRHYLGRKVVMELVQGSTGKPPADLQALTRRMKTPELA